MLKIKFIIISCCLYFGFVGNTQTLKNRIHPIDFINLMEEEGWKFFYESDLFAKNDSLVIPDTNIKSALFDAIFETLQLRSTVVGQKVYLTDRIVLNSFPKSFYTNQEVGRSENASIQDEVTFSEKAINPEYEVIELGSYSTQSASKRYKISGRILMSNNEDPVVGATIMLENSNTGVIADIYGDYEIEVPAGQRKLQYQAVGMRSTTRTIRVYTSGKVDVVMQDEVSELGEVVVYGEKQNDVQNMAIGVERINVKQLEKIPLTLGEKDMVKAILTLPGVQTVTEVSNGFNVRGGGVDQNLVMLDNATIINPSHFFGFFSTFHPDLIEDAVLHKGGISSQYGGRLSSILDINSSRGNMQEFQGNAGISPITGRVSLQGPIIKDKASFIIGGRSTYSDWALNRIKDPRIRDSQASFYDMMGKLSFNIGKRSHLDLMAYKSSDYFDFDGISVYSYSNALTSLSYFWSIRPDFYYDLYFTTSEYKFEVTNEVNASSASKSLFKIDQKNIKNVFHLGNSKQFNLIFGHQGILYNTNPGEVMPASENSAVKPVNLDSEKGLENALFIENEQELNSKLKLSYGLRWSSYASLGAQQVFTYPQYVPKAIDLIQDTITFRKNEIVKFYSGFEPRFVARYKTGNLSSVKLGYNRMYQYLNLLSNNISPAPTDVWKLSGKHFLPQRADQISIGYFKDIVNTHGKVFDISAELYYKDIRNVIDYKLGAQLTANEAIETEIIYGNNKSYGLELQASRKQGELSGWVNYTFSRSLNRFSSNFEEEKLNDGQYFPSNSDKPHSLKTVVNYDFFRRLRTSLNVNYSTGRPLTLPVTAFEFGGKKRVQYGDRNDSRIPDYFRMDFSTTWEGNIKSNKWIHDSYTLSIVNVTSRNNPYSVFFQYDDQDRLRAYTLSIFAQPVVSFTINLSFNE